MTTDHLGSARIITNENGLVTNRRDYAAFGDETVTAQRTSGLKYASDEIRKGYTGYEKDDESGLDFAQARYYNSTHGRFTSVDPLTASANIKNPQTFNRYSYVLNSPYKFVDPLGLISENAGTCGDGCNDDSQEASAREEQQQEKKQEPKASEIPPPPDITFFWEKDSDFVRSNGTKVKQKEKPTEKQQKIIDKLIKDQWAIFYPAAKSAVIRSRNKTEEVSEKTNSKSNGTTRENSLEFGGSLSSESGVNATTKSGVTNQNTVTEAQKTEIMTNLKQILDNDENAVNNTNIAISALERSGVTNPDQVIGKANDFVLSEATKLNTRGANLTPRQPSAMDPPKNPYIIRNIHTNH